MSCYASPAAGGNRAARPPRARRRCGLLTFETLYTFGRSSDHFFRGFGASGTFAPYLKKSIGLAYLPLELARPETAFEVEIRGRMEPATVVPTPFYKRAR